MAPADKDVAKWAALQRDWTAPIEAIRAEKRAEYAEWIADPANREARRLQAQRWREDHRERANAAVRAYKKRHPEVARAYREKNAEKLRAQRRALAAVRRALQRGT